MNSASDDVKDMLEGESSLGLVFADDLFIGMEPAKPDNCVTIFDTPGPPPVLTLEGNGNYYYSSIQIRVRNRSYPTGYALLQQIVQTLHGRGPEDWNGTTYCAISCQGEPALLDWDDNGRARFFVNFYLQRRQ